MPDQPRTDPVLCDHRTAPHIPLCEHAGRARAGELGEGDVGRLVTTREHTGVLVAVHKVDDMVVQLLLEPVKGEPSLATTGAGEVVRVGWAV